MEEDSIWDDLDLLGSLRLLKKVHKVFSKAFHNAKQQNHIEQLSHVSFFKSTLLQLDMALGNLDHSEVPLKNVPKELPDRVERVLNKFERLVLNTVRQHADEYGMPPKSKKLKILTRIPESVSFKFFNFTGLQGTVVQSDVNEAATHCIETLGFFMTQPVVDYWSDDPTEYYSAEDLERRDACVQNWNTLYSQLSAHAGSCRAGQPQGSHQIRLALETLGPCAPQLQLLLSTCDGEASESFVGWQSVNFEHGESNLRDLTPMESGPRVAHHSTTKEWCSLLQRSKLEKDYKANPMRSIYDSTHLRLLPKRSRGSRAAKYQTRPSLAALELSEEIPCDRRKHLQCLLAHSLWLLYGTCWVFGMNTLDGLSIIDTLDVIVSKGEPHRVHVAQCLLWTAGCPTSRSTQPPLPDADFMMKFGLLLLHIEYPNFLHLLQSDDATTISDTETLADVILDSIDDGKFRDRLQASDELTEVIRICLGWDDGNFLEPMYILTNIFVPLLRELRSRFCQDFDLWLSPTESKSIVQASRQSSNTKFSNSSTRGAKLYDDVESPAQ